jgi:hypothetical protein
MVQADHVVPCRWAVGEVDADLRVAPLLDPELAAEPAA